MSDTTQRTGSGGLPPGNVLAGAVYNPSIGATTGHPNGFPQGTPVIQSASADKTVIPGRANSLSTSSVVGLAAIPCVANSHGLVITHGPLTLTAAEWDVITGGNGGLNRGEAYYLDTSAEGKLTATAPSSSGTTSMRVGVAQSPQDMLILIGIPQLNP